MGYSKNKNSLLRVEPFLIFLTKLDEDEAFYSSKTPKDDLYKIREGLNYAVEHKNEYPKLAALKETFILKEEREGIRIKRRQNNFTFNSESVSTVQKLAKSQHLVIDNAVDLLNIIGAIIFHKAPKMEFPNSKVEGDALKRLHAWAEQNQYLITQSNPHIIMEREVINANEESTIE